MYVKSWAWCVQYNKLRCYYYFLDRFVRDHMLRGCLAPYYHTQIYLFAYCNGYAINKLRKQIYRVIFEWLIILNFSLYYHHEKLSKREEKNQFKSNGENYLIFPLDWIKKCKLVNLRKLHQPFSGKFLVEEFKTFTKTKSPTPKKKIFLCNLHFLLNCL